MKNQVLLLLVLIGGMFLMTSCQPECKTCTGTTVTEQYDNGMLTGSFSATVDEERCDDLLEMVEENPVITTESENIALGDTFRIIATTTYVCQ